MTVNVLIKEGELPDLVETLSALEELEVDAAIVQDQAVGSLARRFFPRLRLHASTQMAVHNLQGVERAAALGYRRVVLARELTAKEMGDIRAAVSPEVAELEAFVHGSLCYSYVWGLWCGVVWGGVFVVKAARPFRDDWRHPRTLLDRPTDRYSGLCFFSGEKDARSGNRGECSYACRQPFQITSEDGMGMLFSMLDLDLSAPTDLNLLASAGVDTLKIEGRKKDSQYVSSAVQLYRRRLDQIYHRPTLRPEAPPEARAAVGAAARRGDEELRRDLSLSFHRGTTTFFARGRYHENVIDLGNAGHNGVQAGRVEAVSKDGRSFRFRTDVDLEKYDGLKLVPPERAFHTVPQHGAMDHADDGDAGDGGHGVAPDGLGRLMDKYANALPEFSMRSFRVAGAKAFEAPAGAVVEVDVPPDVRTRRGIRVGDIVYQSRSAELKRRVTGLAAVPDEYKARAWRTVDVEVEVAEAKAQGRLTVAVCVRKLGEEIVREEAALPWEAARREGWTRAAAAQELAELLGVFGDVGFRAGGDGAVAIRGLLREGDGGEEEEEREVPYLPRKELKALKQRIVARIPAAYDELIAQRKAAAMAGLGAGTTALPPAGWSDRRFAIKVDRLEYLELLDEYLSSAPDDAKGLVEEVVFEPKRAFLADTRPEEGTRRLLELARKHGLRARLALPTVNRAWDLPPLRGWVQVFADAATAAGGAACFEVGNLGAWGLLMEMGLGAGNVDLASDFPLYALNHEATAVWARELRPSRVALSVEDDADNLRAQLQRWPTAAVEAGAEPQYILYKDVPLFLAESCSLTALHGGCPGSKACGYRTLSIENDAGEQFEVAHEHCKTVVYGKDAQSLVHRQTDLLQMGVSRFRLDFLTRNYDAPAFTQVLDAALRREATDRRPLPNTHVANFDRRLL